MVFDKFVEIEFGGKKHKLCYPVKQVFVAERQLTDGNIMLMLERASAGIPPNVYDMYIIIKYALMGGNPELKEDEAEALYLAAVEEMPVVDVFKAGMKALVLSGVLGDPKKAGAAIMA
ncbi:MAG: hypothetical protein IJQ91_06960 [Acidaminococcaceae bacterium]|nr:hypothetical protein [Acidaminococcaceae bacterium]